MRLIWLGRESLERFYCDWLKIKEKKILILLTSLFTLALSGQFKEVQEIFLLATMQFCGQSNEQAISDSGLSQKCSQAELSTVFCADPKTQLTFLWANPAMEVPMQVVVGIDTVGKHDDHTPIRHLEETEFNYC
ncbi:hypothetical protein AVEN_10750-1 [Araneus ventricosus]|uniref:Uncharacterized protein n=1 Tax=Araneus ventricosus TaxID=182803 RepID=A0A4Y2LJQ4_ARAVE|nr:hypothetical protein AVEN_10750-1 [Araneus ventricosus]